MKINDIMKKFWGMMGVGEDLIKTDKEIKKMVIELDEYLETNHEEIQEKEKGFLKNIENFYDINTIGKGDVLTISVENVMKYLISKSIPFHDIITMVLAIPKEYIETYTNLELKIKGKPSIDQFMEELEDVEDVDVNNDKVLLMRFYTYILICDKKKFIDNPVLVKNLHKRISTFILDNPKLLNRHKIFREFLVSFSNALIALHLKDAVSEAYEISYRSNVKKVNVNVTDNTHKILINYLLFNLKRIGIDLDKELGGK